MILSEGEALLRAGLRALLEEDGTVTVVGEAATGEETLELAAQLDPDVVLSMRVSRASTRWRPLGACSSTRTSP